MPLFDFHCEQCDTVSELLRRISDTEAPICPKCGSTQMHKCLATPSAPGKSKAIIASARAAANKEGHFSNFSSSERRKLLKS